MYNSVITRRWTHGEIDAFYDTAAVVRLRRRCASSCAIGLLFATLIQPLWYFVWVACALVLAIGTDYWAKTPLRSRLRYENLCAEWRELLDRSSPRARIPTSANILEGEYVIYAQPAARFVDRIVNGAVIAAVIDEGELVITDQRVLFLGKAQTLAISKNDMVRYPPSASGARVTFEYSQRPKGETFSINVPLFQLCMNRRGNFREFACEPLAPLPLDVVDTAVSPSRSAEVLA